MPKPTQKPTQVKTTQVFGTNGIDSLVGTSGNDEIFGYPKNRSPEADTGNDTLSGLDGNDSLWGDGADDLLIGGLGADFLSGGLGIDTASYQSSFAGVNVWLGGNSGTGGDAQGDTFDAVENVIGSAFADGITGDNAPNLLVGLAGADALDGGAGNDRLEGGDGEDQLLGSAGDDTLVGGSGADALDGGAGNDRLEGSDGEDHLLGSAGDDTLAGGAGADFLQDGVGFDFLDYSTSSAAVEVLLYTPTIAVETGMDGVARGGDAQGDVLQGAFEGVIGSAFGDFLSGWSLHGGPGNDWLSAPLGVGAEMWGDAGADVFLGDSGINNPDTIHDFEGAGAAGGDIINIGSHLYIGEVDFLPVEGAALAGFGNQRNDLFFSHVGDFTYIAVDRNDNAILDGNSDTLIKLDGIHNLIAADFSTGWVVIP